MEKEFELQNKKPTSDLKGSLQEFFPQVQTRPHLNPGIKKMP